MPEVRPAVYMGMAAIGNMLEKAVAQDEKRLAEKLAPMFRGFLNGKCTWDSYINSAITAMKEWEDDTGRRIYTHFETFRPLVVPIGA